MSIEPTLNRSYYLLGKIMFLPFLFFFIAMAIAYTKFGYDKEVENNNAAVARIIERQNKLLSAAIASGDAEAVARYFTNDAELITENALIIKGRKNIETKFSDYIKQGLTKYSLFSSRLLHNTDTVTMEEVFAFSNNSNQSASKNKSVSIWKKVDGEYKLFKKSIFYDRTN